MNVQEYASLYKNELLNSVIPFWLNKSQDFKNGGYFTCLDRAGNIYDTDKFIWLQGRQTWFFSMAYNNIEKKQEWLDCAIQGAEFLNKFGHDGAYNWYFSLTQEGKPLIQPYNIFSYCFATMAFGQLSKATGKAEYADIAKKTFDLILQKQNNPKGIYNKAVDGTRPLKNFALPMILCNLTLEIEHLLEKEFIDEVIANCIHEVMEVFYRPGLGVVVENVTPDGRMVDCYEGRVLNPGHAIEAMWFIMDLGVRLNNKKLIEDATQIALKMIEKGWDEKHGGIFYFMDIFGKPLQQLEWDQKLWWVHVETLISMLKGYQLTGNPECWKWFEKIHDYTWNHFKDQEFPEWFGYLNRQGEVLLPLKGGKWKGCFHVPRGLFQCYTTLEKL